MTSKDRERLEQIEELAKKLDRDMVVENREKLMSVITDLESVLVDSVERLGNLDKECNCMGYGETRQPYVYVETSDEPGTVFCIICGGLIYI